MELIKKGKSFNIYYRVTCKLCESEFKISKSFLKNKKTYQCSNCYKINVLDETSEIIREIINNINHESENNINHESEDNINYELVDNINYESKDLKTKYSFDLPEFDFFCSKCQNDKLEKFVYFDKTKNNNITIYKCNICNIIL